MSEALLPDESAEAWGLTEMASDALLENTVSYDAHIHSGYSEVERVVQFRKDLAPGP